MRPNPGGMRGSRTLYAEGKANARRRKQPQNDFYNCDFSHAPYTSVLKIGSRAPAVRDADLGREKREKIRGLAITAE